MRRPQVFRLETRNRRLWPTRLIDDLSPTRYPQVLAGLANGRPVRTYTDGLERIIECLASS